MNDARRQEIVNALRALRDVSETLQRGDAGGRFEPGSKLLTMPAAYHHGVFPHLTRRLEEIQATYREHYRHLESRYIVSQREPRYIVRIGSRNFEALTYTAFEGPFMQTRYYAGERLPSNTEILPGEMVELTARVRRHAPDAEAGASFDATPLKLVRAIVERWDEWVEMRKVSRCLDFLSFYLPREIVMPRDTALVA